MRSENRPQTDARAQESLLVVHRIGKCKGPVARPFHYPICEQQPEQRSVLLASVGPTRNPKGRHSGGRQEDLTISYVSKVLVLTYVRGCVGSDELTRRDFSVRSASLKPVRGGLAESPNGPVAGLSPEICGECGLTSCKARSTAHSANAQGWSVSRPESAAPNLVTVEQLKPQAYLLRLIVPQRNDDSKPTTKRGVHTLVRRDGNVGANRFWASTFGCSVFLPRCADSRRRLKVSIAISANSLIRDGLFFGKADLAGCGFVSGT